MSSFVYPSSKTPIDILLGCTGSIASVKLPCLSLHLHSLGYTHSIVLTKSASFFIDEEHEGSARVYDEERYLKWRELVDEGKVQVYRGDDEWNCLRGEGVRCGGKGSVSVCEGEKTKKNFTCPVLHITLRSTHRLLLLAPLSANSLSKYALGLCDDTLSSLVRAWEVTKKSAVICPAMNTDMWEHPVTGKRLIELKGFWSKGSECVIVQPAVKMLACGTEGRGAMAEIDDVVKVVNGLLPRGGGKRETRGERIKRMVVEAARKKFEERKEVSVIMGAERSDDV
ncbi:hypothetical protein TL16_g10320 [Triparma laevis f. inornata]|uniref:Flavoprotein domain-containing protein n=1 Tax=Triparma laevis f. inornata TaxID=1714386 RepID=A0A9W7EP66_9STRA|nr:hypothetical protein TL16_g10320 [Triparma laevis f. inornata]